MTLSQRLAGKTAIITGAAQGMGAVTAKTFIEQGANVILADVQVDKGQALADSLGDKAAFMKLDVTCEDDWAAAVTLAASFGP